MLESSIMSREFRRIPESPRVNLPEHTDPDGIIRLTADEFQTKFLRECAKHIGEKVLIYDSKEDSVDITASLSMAIIRNTQDMYSVMMGTNRETGELNVAAVRHNDVYRDAGVVGFTSMMNAFKCADDDFWMGPFISRMSGEFYGSVSMRDKQFVVSDRKNGGTVQSLILFGQEALNWIEKTDEVREIGRQINEDVDRGAYFLAEKPNQDEKENKDFTAIFLKKCREHVGEKVVIYSYRPKDLNYVSEVHMALIGRGVFEAYTASDDREIGFPVVLSAFQKAGRKRFQGPFIGEDITFRGESGAVRMDGVEYQVRLDSKPSGIHVIAFGSEVQVLFDAIDELKEISRKLSDSLNRFIALGS